MENSKRNSGIELVKVAAILLIILSHVVYALIEKNQYMPYSDYIVDLGHATTDFQTFVLSVFRYAGSLGNSIFFLCSAWFLLERGGGKKPDSWKILTMMLQVWSISFISLAITLLIKGGDVPFKLIIKSLFPLFFNTKWYVACYILFYAIHPMLNYCIGLLKQADLLKAATILGILYCGFNYIYTSFFYSELILWVAIYFIMAYLKGYMHGLCNNIKMNTVFIIAGFCGNIFIVFVTNILGLHIKLFENQLLYWNRNCSPFLLLMAFGMLNIGRCLHLKSKCINYISGLSILIYIIHTNLFLRTYIYPYIWELIHDRFGYDYILCWVLLQTVVIFIISLMLSTLYKATIQSVITYLVPKIKEITCKIYQKYEYIIMKLS